MMTFEGTSNSKISEEENPSAESECGVREAEIRVHGELGEADVHAIEIVDEVAEHQERDEAIRHPPEGEAFNVGRHARFSP